MSEIEKKTMHFSGAGSDLSIVQMFNPDKKHNVDLPPALPILALRNVVIFPGSICPITVGREKSKALVEFASKNDCEIGAVPQTDMSVEDPAQGHLSQYGVLARVIKIFELPDGNISVVLQALNRIKLEKILMTKPFLRASVSYADDVVPSLEDESQNTQLNLIADALKESAINILNSYNSPNKEVIKAIKGFNDSFPFFVNYLATCIEIDDYSAKIQLLSIENIRDRAMALLAEFKKQEELLRFKQEINSKARFELDQQQREYYLNNQLKTIQEELGMDESEDIRNFREKAETKKWPEEVKKSFLKELLRLERLNSNSPDYNTLFTYLQFMIELPWGEYSKDNLDLKHAQKVLDEDHYGLDEVKDRIIEYLSVLKLKGNMKSPILCLYGAPGVGKTSLGKSIARALGRKYVRIALGGMHDEAEIRGHRRTYIGAMAGRIIAGINKAGTSNPVIVLDEIDKLSTDFKGDPSSALLEALDPEQNMAFHDNYLDQDYDLSNVLFLTTANTISTIQPALLDRLELINVSGYLEEEKVEIAKKFLLPKQLKEHGLKKTDLKLDKAVLEEIIENYTRESGVRGLDKKISKICRRIAKKIAFKEEYDVKLKKSDVREYLGLPVASYDKQEGNELPGVVTGLAWTSVGGEILFIESSISQGKGVLSMTGSLGDVMKESASIAYQYIKAHPEIVNMTAEEFAKKDVHVHVPEGAVPKDGPSAGITLISSMVSAFRNTKIRSKCAMTGEMTLRGKVLPVGGIKEKILAAKRAGVKTIILSKENEKHIKDIKDIYIQGLDFVYVENIDEVLNFIFPKK